MSETITTGDEVFWADADQRTPFHLRIRKAKVTGFKDKRVKIEAGGHPFLVEPKELFKTMSRECLDGEIELEPETEKDNGVCRWYLDQMKNRVITECGYDLTVKAYGCICPKCHKEISRS
jgi:hypothetical protein